MEEFIKKIYSKSLLVIGIIICLFGILVGSIAYLGINNQDAIFFDRVNDDYAYSKMNVYMLDEYFAYEKTDTDIYKYYVAYDEANRPFIVVLNEDNLNNLKDIQDYSLGVSNNDTRPNAVTIYGESKKIDEDIYKYLQEYINNEAETNYSVDDIKNIVGDYYLDTYYNSSEDMNFIIGLNIFIIVIGGLFILVYVLRINKNKKIMINNKDIIEKVMDDVNNNKGIYSKLCKVFLTKDYIITYNAGLKIINTKDIIWVYEFVMKQNGISTNKVLYGINKLGKSNIIASINPLNKKKNNALEELYQDMMNMIPGIMYGYSKENQDKVKEMVKKK